MYSTFVMALGLINGCSTASLESESSTMSCDAASTASQETAIMRDDLSHDEGNKTHSRYSTHDSTCTWHENETTEKTVLQI